MPKDNKKNSNQSFTDKLFSQNTSKSGLHKKKKFDEAAEQIEKDAKAQAKKDFIPAKPERLEASKKQKQSQRKFNRELKRRAGKGGSSPGEQLRFYRDADGKLKRANKVNKMPKFKPKNKSGIRNMIDAPRPKDLQEAFNNKSLYEALKIPGKAPTAGQKSFADASSAYRKGGTVTMGRSAAANRYAGRS